MHEQLHKALDRKVWLPSGGSLIIEHTEALTVIDVNTGKNVGTSSLEETVFRNNLEAAEEIARQLRLRDIGGIIVIDFIDMEIKANRDAVIRAFRDALARDKTRTQVFDISELGLVEMTRKRIGEGLLESFADHVPDVRGPRRGASLDVLVSRSMAGSDCAPGAVERRLALVDPLCMQSSRPVASSTGSRRASRSRSSGSATSAPRSTFTPVLLVDGDTVLATPDQLAGATVRPGSSARPRAPRSTASPTRPSPTSGSAGATASTTPRSRSPASQKG